MSARPISPLPFRRLADDPELCRKLSARALALMHSTESPLEDVLTAAQPFGFEDLQLRTATLGDAAELLAWRNQPEVRQFSRNQGSIDYAAHVRWLAGVIDDPRRHLLIGWREDKPVGVLRLDERRGRRGVDLPVPRRPWQRVMAAPFYAPSKPGQAPAVRPSPACWRKFYR